ncbi:hypothetical protein AAG570_007174 [Ranatra chinensis]|uniref:Uncharacterized protein n=1 Tax=Ranatra chinensis TaxID=642074 RepID=A0ABD0Y881_9HEMI
MSEATPAEHAQTNPATSRRLYRDVVASKALTLGAYKILVPTVMRMCRQESAGARMVEGQEHAVNGGQQQPWEDQEAVYARLEKEALEQYTSRETDHAVGELEESAGAGMAEGQEHAVNGGHQPPWEDPEDVYARMENEALEQYIPWETEHPAGEQHLEERAGDKRVEGQEHEVTGGHRQPWEDPEAVYARMEKEALEQYTPSKTDLPDGELEESAGVRRAEGEERATTRGQQQQWEDPEAVYTRMEKEALEQYIPWGTELPAGGLQLEATDRKPRVAQEVRGTSPPAGVSEDATRSGEDSGTPTVRAPVSPKTPVDSHIGGTARTNPWRTGGASSRADDGRPTVGRQPDKKPPRGRKKKTIERRGKGPTVPAQPISSLHFKESDAKPIAVRLKWTMLNYLKEVDWRGGSCGGGGGPQSGAGRTAAHPGVAAYKSVVSQLLYGPVVLSPLMVTRVRISDISDSDTLRAYLKELVHTMKVDLSETYRRVRGEAVDATSRGQVVTVKPTTREKRRVRQMIKRLVALEGRLDRLERPIKFQVEQLRKDIREALNLIHTTMDVVYTLKDMTESASNELDYYRNVKRVLVDAILGASTLCDLKPHFLNRIMDEFGPLILRHMPKAAAESKDVHSWNKHPTSEDQRVVPKAKPAPERTARSVAAAVTAANTRSTSCAVESAKTSSMSVTTTRCRWLDLRVLVRSPPQSTRDNMPLLYRRLGGTPLLWCHVNDPLTILGFTWRRFHNPSYGSGWMLPPFEELPREDRTVLIFCLAERAIKL